MAQLTEKKKNSVVKIKKYFSWFDDTFSSVIREINESFWKQNFDIRLFSLEKNSKNFFSGNDYFVTQAQMNNITYSARLSDTLCEMFLVSSLGENEEGAFFISKLTDLESNIFNNYNKKIFIELKKFFISKKEIEKLLDEEENFEDYLNFGFVVKDKNDEFEVGKLFISIPEKLLKYPEIETQEGIIDVTRFKKAKAPVDIYVGKTKLSLDDINNMEPEDIVVLENSNIKKMKITNPTVCEFNVNPDPRLFIKDEDEFNDNEIQEDKGVSTKDIWDNVQVDVCAKFPKVKMSLGELREMTAGVVMELDSVYDNEVILEVENKNVAKGELVIVGYKYGVKITEIFDQTEDNVVENNVGQEETDDDFNVNDFEIDE